MPVEAKPLFRPDVLRPYLMAFQLPAHVPGCRPKLAHWADLISSGRADSFKEQEILPDFLTDFFCGLLGYTRPADGGERYTISRERLVEVNGKFADAVLGDFSDGKAQFVVALEGKGPKDPLDRPYAGRRVSAVDQGYHYVRGQDIARWNPDWAGLWMIAIKSSENHDWSWSACGDDAESLFKKTYPSIYEHMKPLEAALRKRQDKGRFWWELRSCAYWSEFDKPKIVYQEIQFHPCYSLDSTGQYGNNKTFFVPSGDLYLLAVLNSPLMWWHNWRHLPHMKDEALSPVGFLMETLPIAAPTDEIRRDTEQRVVRLVEINRTQRNVCHTILDWLRVEYAVEKPTKKLEALLEMDSDALVAEVKKIRGKKKPLTAAALQNLRQEHSRSIEPVRALAAEALQLENEISCLVNKAYGLTLEEIALMWDTAPPRMPIPKPT